MTDPKPPDSTGDDASLDLSDLQDLSFGPAWGAGMPGTGQSAGRSQRSSGGGDRRERRDRPQGDRRERRREGGAPSGARPDRRGPRPGRERAEETVPFTPVVEVDFYPEDEPFDILMKGFKTSLRTYELFELARIFLAKPDRFVFVVEPLKGKTSGEEQLYLAHPSKIPFLTEAEAIDHALAGEMERRLDTFEVEVDPPKGNFQVVHRCGVTGKLIGPPNYHRYQDMLREHHATEVGNLSFERFRDRLIAEKDPAVIDEWVQSQSKQTRYRLKKVEPDPPTNDPVPEDTETGETTGGAAATEDTAAAAPSQNAEAVNPPDAGPVPEVIGTEAASPAPEATGPDVDAESEATAGPETPLPSSVPDSVTETVDASPEKEFATLAEARQYFRTERKDELVQSFKKIRLNGKVIESMPRGPLRRSIEAVWEDQKRFPLQTANNLRGKLRRANCHIYKRGKKGISYVCAVRRRLRDPRAVYADSVQRVIDFLDANPRTKVSELSGKLLGISREEMETRYSPDEREVADKQLRQLGRDLLWLKSEGYVSEYSDGSLEVQPINSGPSAKGGEDPVESGNAPVYSTDAGGMGPESGLEEDSK